MFENSSAPKMGLSIRRTALALCIATYSFAQTQVNVLTGNYDNRRTNANLQETILTPANVNSNSFGMIGTFPVDGQIYAQPLYASGIQISGQGTRNVVYVATMHNSVYAINADLPESTVPLWHVNLGPSVPSSLLNFSDILPETGILSTPVIDLSKQAIYVVADTLVNGGPVFQIHALSLSDGHEMFSGPAAISATVQGNGAASYFGTLQFDPMMHLQRPALALSKGIVYVSFGSHADGGAYHGWMLGYNSSNLKSQVSLINLSPNGAGAAVWQSGRGPAIDQSGNLYIASGNGDFDGSSNFGESVIKLSSDLKVLDYYTPNEWADLNENDWDLGSTGVILIPGTNSVLTGAKSGLLYLINGAMGHLGPDNTGTVHSVQVNQWGMFDFALWNNSSGPIVYEYEPYGALQAFRIVNGTIQATALSQNFPAIPSQYAGIAVTANGGTNGTGIVWETTGDYSSRLVPGTLHALDASDISNELWNSNIVPDRDTLGRFAKFVVPTVVNGRVYAPTFSNSLAIYGLLASGSSGSGAPQITAVANGASFLADAVSPGEVLAVFGANLGPAQLTNLQMNAGGQVTSTLANTQIFFDGVSAPMLYTSANQIGAVVPFGTAGPTTQVVVSSQGQSSSALTMPVLPATPALFSLDGTGGGPGAILNQDGSPNSAANPADRGSVVVLYGTGAGQTDPAGEDGMISGGLPLSTPLLPMTVFIDNQPAEVLYAGAAPGMVQGVIQINARVPDTASIGPTTTVMFKVGDYASPNTVTLSVR
jgi:uncharacterized protein (TIGR03437 family)